MTDVPVAGAPVVLHRPAPGNGKVVWSGTGGVVVCADARSGAKVWMTERSSKGIVPLAIADNVAVGVEMPSVMFAVDMADGREVWRHALPGPAGHLAPVTGCGGVLLAVQGGVVLVRPEGGDVMATWSWPGKLICQLAAGAAMAFAVLSIAEDSIHLGRHTVVPNESRIVRLDAQKVIQWELATEPRWPRIAWDEKSGHLFEAFSGLGVINPETGIREHVVAPEGSGWFLLEPRVEDDRIYMLSVNAELVCLQSPLEDWRG